METNTLKVFGQIAGVGGLALGVALIIFRDIIRKNIFPNLTKSQAYRLLILILVLVWSLAIIGIGAWIYTYNITNNKPILPTEKVAQPVFKIVEEQQDWDKDILDNHLLIYNEGAPAINLSYQEIEFLTARRELDKQMQSHRFPLFAFWGSRMPLTERTGLVLQLGRTHGQPSIRKLIDDFRTIAETNGVYEYVDLEIEVVIKMSYIDTNDISQVQYYRLSPYYMSGSAKISKSDGDRLFDEYKSLKRKEDVIDYRYINDTVLHQILAKLVQPQK